MEFIEIILSKQSVAYGSYPRKKGDVNECKREKEEKEVEKRGEGNETGKTDWMDGWMETETKIMAKKRIDLCAYFFSFFDILISPLLLRSQEQQRQHQRQLLFLRYWSVLKKYPKIISGDKKQHRL